jgi:predicted HTH transcriptional regulator
MDLKKLLGEPEGKQLEFKRDLSSPEGILKTIIAFANTSGGILLIGVENRTQRVLGIPNILAEEERLASIIADSITPKLIPSIETISWRRQHLLAVEVAMSPTRPHHLTSMGEEKGTLVRLGSTNRRADHALITELRRNARISSFDEQPMPDVYSEAIDFRVASEYFKPIRKLTRESLHTLKLLTRYQGRSVPTVAGLLLFAPDPTEYFPDAWIQVGRFAGEDRRKILDSAEVRGPLPGLIPDVVAFLRKHMRREAVIGSVKRTDVWTYPEVALREVLINTLVHTDYSQRGAPIRVSMFDERLEIENPGTLPFGLTIEDLHHSVSRLRNRAIGRVFQELGLVEHWGSGIERMTRACEDQGLAAPKFEEIGLRFRVTLSSVPYRKPVIDSSDRKILNALARASKGMSTAQVALRIGYSSRGTRTRLAALVGRGLVVEIGSSPQDPQRRYFLVPGK